MPNKNPIPTEKDLTLIRKLCFDFVEKFKKVHTDVVQEHGMFSVTMYDIEKAVFLIEGEDGLEIRLSCETGSWFSDYFLTRDTYYGNYTVDEVMKYIREESHGKFIVETYSEGYLVAYKQP